MGIIKETVDGVGVWLSCKKDDTVMAVRQKYVKDWMEICGVQDPNDIDYKNPHVIIQWRLCDPYWQRRIQTEKGRQAFFETIGDEAKEVYLTYVGDDGSSYRDMEKLRFKSAYSSESHAQIKEIRAQQKTAKAEHKQKVAEENRRKKEERKKAKAQRSE